MPSHKDPALVYGGSLASKAHNCKRVLFDASKRPYQTTCPGPFSFALSIHSYWQSKQLFCSVLQQNNNNFNIYICLSQFSLYVYSLFSYFLLLLFLLLLLLLLLQMFFQQKAWRRHSSESDSTLALVILMSL